MSKKLIILFSLIICLVISAPRCLAADTDEKTSEITVSLNEELINYSKLALDQIDLDAKHLSVVKNLYRSGKYVEALQAYKPIFFDNIQKMAEAGLRKPTGTANIKYADDLLENYVNRNDDSGLVHRI